MDQSRRKEIENYDFSFKIALVGESKAGKTSLLHYGEKISHKRHTGIDFRIKLYKINGLIIRVQYWDCPGNVLDRPLVKQYCGGATGVVFVFDVSKENALQRIAELVDSVDHVTQNIPKLLIGNRMETQSDRDGNDSVPFRQRCVGMDEAERFAKHRNMIYFEASSSTGKNVTNAFNALLSRIMSSIPSEWDAFDLSTKEIKVGPRRDKDERKHKHVQRDIMRDMQSCLN